MGASAAPARGAPRGAPRAPCTAAASSSSGHSAAPDRPGEWSASSGRPTQHQLEQPRLGRLDRRRQRGEQQATRHRRRARRCSPAAPPQHTPELEESRPSPRRAAPPRQRGHIEWSHSVCRKSASGRTSTRVAAAAATAAGAARRAPAPATYPPRFSARSRRHRRP